MSFHAIKNIDTYTYTPWEFHKEVVMDMLDGSSLTIEEHSSAGGLSFHYIFYYNMERDYSTPSDWIYSDHPCFLFCECLMEGFKTKTETFTYKPKDNAFYVYVEERK